MSYSITASTTSDQIASFLNAEFSAIYNAAIQASFSAATVISNICTVPSPLVNPPLYALQLIPQLEKVYFIDLERSPAVSQVKARILSCLNLVQQIVRSVLATPNNLANLLSGRLLIISAMAASRLTYSPLGALQLACQGLASTLTTAELAIAALDVANLLSAFAADVQGVDADIAAAYQLAATTASSIAQGGIPALASITIPSSEMMAAMP